MPLQIDVSLSYLTAPGTDILAQVQVAQMPDQTVFNATLDIPNARDRAEVTAENHVGVRTWVQADGQFDCTYSARVGIDRPEPDLAQLPFIPPHQLPGETVRFLMPSRYCPSDKFFSFVGAEFGQTMGGARVVAIRDWIAERIAYMPGTSSPLTTALDTFVERRGVCRDFAHMFITLCRASTVPARFVSAYGPDVTPQDFHAVAEVWLGDAWHLVDCTGMSRPGELARIGVGLDAAEVAFLTSFGPVTLQTQTVSVQRVD